MTILVSGSTGKIGSQVIDRLKDSGVEVRGLTRSPEKAAFPSGVVAVKGDLMDVTSMRAALKGVTTFFLLAPNDADEITQAVNTLGVARDAGVKGVVYLSVVRSAEYSDVAHFTAKHAVERMIEERNVPATILRPSYFFQNDGTLKNALLNGGIYPSPIGSKGISMVDVGDIAAAAAIELLRRERATSPLPREVFEISGPDALTGVGLAELWAEILGRDVRYGGGDLDAFENQMRETAPSWRAYDIRQMFRRYQEDGAAASKADLERFAELLGRPPRSYRDFAEELAKSWES